MVLLPPEGSPQSTTRAPCPVSSEGYVRTGTGSPARAAREVASALSGSWSIVELGRWPTSTTRPCDEQYEHQATLVGYRVAQSMQVQAGAGLGTAVYW